MKIHEYREMMRYLTRPATPAELSRAASVERQEYATGGRVEQNIDERRDLKTKKIFGYRVRSRVGDFSEYFGLKEYGSKEKALEAARKFKKEIRKNVLTNEEYLKLRNKHLDKNSRQFTKFLNENNILTRKGKDFTRDLVKLRDQEIGFKSPFQNIKFEVDPKLKDEIFEKYKLLKTSGQREGSIINLGREYFPGSTRDTQSNRIANILKEKGEDISAYKKTGTGEKAAKQKVRRERLREAGKYAGFKAKNLADEIILDIKAMNKKVVDMPLEEIAKNQKFINSMRINANMDNLSQSKITFDKYKDMTDLQIAEKIKERAKVNKFFDVEHISSVKGQARNIYYPNNIQMVFGNMGSFMENFKRIAYEQPRNSVISQIDKILSDFNLTVRDSEKKIRLGNQSIIEVKNGISNIVVDNFKTTGVPFEKQTITGVPKKPYKLFSDPTGIGAALDTPFGQTLSKKVPNFVKGVARVSTLTGTPFAALMGVAMYSGDLKERGTSDLEALGYSALKGTTQDLLNFGDLLIRKLPVATYEKFVEKKPFLESLLDKPEYFTFVDDFVDKQIEKMSTVEKIDNRAKLAARKEIPNIISDTEVPDPRTTEEFNESIQKNKKAILDADPLVKKLYEKEMAAPKEVKPDPSKTSTILGPIVFPKYTSEQLNLASGGPAKFKTELEDDLYIAPLPKSNPTPKEGILNLKFDREDD